MPTLKHPTLTGVTVEADESRAPEWVEAGWQTTGPEAAGPGSTTAPRPRPSHKPRNRTAATEEN